MSGATLEPPQHKTVSRRFSNTESHRPAITQESFELNHIDSHNSKSIDNSTYLSGINTEESSVGEHNVAEALTEFPDGGFQAWFQVFLAFIIQFSCVGFVYSWGVFQDALVKRNVAPSSTLAWVGSTQVLVQAITGIPVGRAIDRWGKKKVVLLGSTLMGLAAVCAGFFVNSFPGLVCCQGILFGLGQSCAFFSVATHASTYFTKNKNLATGVIFAGGGIGGASYSLIVERLIARIGLSWTWRIVGFIIWGTCLPAASLLQTRSVATPGSSKSPIVDWSLMKNVRYILILLATAIGLFPLFVPPFFLPLYVTTLGMSAAIASYIAAGYNLASAFGRVMFGLGADRLLGSVNSLFMCLFICGVTTLSIWPFAESLALLSVFAIINGICSGGFFSLMPGVLGVLIGPSRLGTAYSMMFITWAPGYFLGSPIAGYILAASGGESAGFAAFRPAIFYAGALSMAACILVLIVRSIESKSLWKRV